MLVFLKEYFRVLLKGKIPGLSSLKYYKRWSRLLGKNPLDERQPWFTFKAIDFVTENSGKINKVFEFGGGGSTTYFLDKAAEVVTVEHDPEWFHLLQNKIGSNGSQKWHGQLVLPEESVDTRSLDIARPLDYFSADPLFKEATFKAYSTFICQFNDEYFDLVLIDGRARTSCLFHAVPKVKIGGLLLLDNSERTYYMKNNLMLLKEHYRLLINHTGPVPYSPFFSETTIWQRIK
jgi:hypothetical protein